MKGSRFIFNLFAIVALTLTAASFARAQALRSFVTGLGDDANPCSRSAPCRTFSGALAKTADGGEINVIDSGSFGVLTITKSITIDGGGTYSGILAAGSNGVNVNDSNTAAPNSIVVTLRNISIDGGGTGLTGVRITSAKSVTIENCSIFKFRGSGGLSAGRAISDERSAAGGKLTVVNTTINDNGANAVVVNPSSGTSGVTAMFDNVRVFDNSISGFFFGLGAKATIKNSFITTNGNAGVQSQDVNTKVNIMDTVISNNAAHGIFAGTGASVTRITRCTITENNSGITVNGGTVESFGDNNIRGNVNNGTAFLTQVGQL